MEHVQMSEAFYLRWMVLFGLLAAAVGGPAAGSSLSASQMQVLFTGIADGHSTVCDLQRALGTQGDERSPALPGAPEALPAVVLVAGKAIDVPAGLVNALAASMLRPASDALTRLPELDYFTPPGPGHAFSLFPRTANAPPVG
jgi:hypothetical protein